MNSAVTVRPVPCGARGATVLGVTIALSMILMAPSSAIGADTDVSVPRHEHRHHSDKQDGESRGSASITILAMRHADKNLQGDPHGNLDCAGLNRAIQIVPKFIALYLGKPDEIFVPDPSVQIDDYVDPKTKKTYKYDYVRPIATALPYAIALEMPINAYIGYDKTKELEKAIVASQKSKVLVIWEHGKLQEWLNKLYPSGNFKWAPGDFETAYVLQATVENGALKIKSSSKETQQGTPSSKCPG